MNDRVETLERPAVAGATPAVPLERQITAIAPAAPRRRESDRALLESESLENIDRLVNATLAPLTFGLSPVTLQLAYLDWLVHLAASPGKQYLLGEKVLRKTMRYLEFLARCARDPEAEPCIDPLPQDRRFRAEAWQRLPYKAIYQAFLLHQQWWYNATTGVRGVSRHHESLVEFFARQYLDMLAPANSPWLNPEIQSATVTEGGANLLRGTWNFWQDMGRKLRDEPPVGAENYRVGHELAITPGKVVFRNRLIELIQYSPTTDKVQREPVLMISAWMMKYYIMDLQPDDSMVKYLVDRGHTVFMISWKNPGSEDRDLGMEDYRRLGVMAALDAIGEIVPEQKIHAVGYCLGGILLTIAAATMARDGDERLASLSLLTTLTDFTEVGEMAVFMDTSQIAYMEDMMWQRGYLEPKMSLGSFQLLRSRDLIWSKMVREYYLGNREPMNDLMAWNADGTRMPHRQHSELLRRLYHDNQLFQGRYMVEGRPISISSIHVPMFVVAASRDHVAPWQSVYKIHLQSDACELTFVLASGGHNVGIIAVPGEPKASYQMATCYPRESFPDADNWEATTPREKGSWWPAWQKWLEERSSGRVAPPTMGAADRGLPPLADAPGSFVLMQ
ncbi:MAG: alpha/beta fold hydrolase [Rhodospirillales bacterium]|nr:MAG: alpha/beta fold hydrolase [Rhodospirillales bacterium]